MFLLCWPAFMHENSMRHRHLILECILLMPLSKENISFTLKYTKTWVVLTLEFNIKAILTFPWVKLNFLFTKKKYKVSTEFWATLEFTPGEINTLWVYNCYRYAIISRTTISWKEINRSIVFHVSTVNPESSRIVCEQFHTVVASNLSCNSEFSQWNLDNGL